MLKIFLPRFKFATFDDFQSLKEDLVASREKKNTTSSYYRLFSNDFATQILKIIIRNYFFQNLTRSPP